MSNILSVFSFLGMIFFTNYCYSQNYKYYVVDTIISSCLSDEVIDLKSYLNINEWSVVINTHPYTVEQINIKTRERKLYKFNQSESRKYSLNSIYSNSEWIFLIFDHECQYMNINTGEIQTINFPKDYSFSYCGLNNGKLMFYGAYNFHIKDGWPMLQLGVYDMDDKMWKSYKRLPFPGIEYTSLLNQFFAYNEGKLSYITPFGRYIKVINDELNLVDSIDIYKNKDYLEYNNPNDNKYNSLIEHKINNNLKKANASTNVKEIIMQIKAQDSLVQRNEKLYYNAQNYIVTIKPLNYSGWAKRESITIDANSHRILDTREINLDRKVHFNDPVLINSSVSFLLTDEVLGIPNSFQFYDPTIKDGSEYDQKLNDWAIKNDNFYHTMILYKLLINE